VSGQLEIKVVELPIDGTGGVLSLHGERGLDRPVSSCKKEGIASVGARRPRNTVHQLRRTVQQQKNN